MTSLQFVDESGVLNGGGMGGGPFALDMKMKRSATEAGLNDDSDSDSDCTEVGRFLAQGPMQPGNPNGPKPGKKTKGRVKIKMEFIENKLRRYTTFSKRKTGIMKKAYELSTLTGTQVMLLVASETGHVYTFATRKLQPMITSESGKALIQTCLNSPDPPPSSHSGASHGMDQRMNPTGFEETELSYAVAEEEAGAQKPDSPPAAHMAKPTAMVYGAPMVMPSLSAVPASTPSPQAQPQNLSLSSQAASQLQMLGSPSSTVSQPTAVNTPNKQQTVSMQLPGGAIATLLPQSGSLSTGTPLTLSPMAGSTAALSGQQAVYQLPSSAASQVLLPGGMSAAISQQASSRSPETNVTSLSSIQTTNGSGNNTSTTSTSSSRMMQYQTQQGVVYAAAPTSAAMSAIPEGYVLNLPQSSTLQLQGESQQTAGGYITIPVPVSLTQGATQALLELPLLAQRGTADIRNMATVKRK